MVVLILLILGLCLGSFVNALVWRLHNNAGKKNKKLSILSGRSICPNCRHQLKALDLVPVFSWLSLGGKCRYCRHKISWHYPATELITASLFVISYVFWPADFNTQEAIIFGLWLVFLTGFIALALYDLKWFVLPNSLIYPLLGLAAIQTVGLALYNQDAGVLGSALWGVLIGGGLFYLLFQASGGRWIGGGDVKLGALAGILIGGPLGSLLMIFTASLLGTFISVPLVVAGKAKSSTKVPFGPFLIAAAIIVQLFGASIVQWYKAHILMI